MSRTINIVLITILICVTAWSLYISNWHIFTANICIISAVFIEEKTTKLLLKENVNFRLVRKIQKILVPLLYVIGAVALILLGYSKF